MTYRLGLCVVLLGFFVATVAVATAAQTQPPDAPPLPLAVDLGKVPVGSWSEYRIADGTHGTVVRMALVARQGRLADIETQVKAGSISAITRIMRMSGPIEDAAEVTPRDRVIQLGEDPPMSLPAETPGAPAQVFRKLDVQKRVGVDAVTVPAGAFRRAEHYRDRGKSGQTLDFWINRAVLPFGLIKMTSSRPLGGGSVTMELTGHGGGAKPLITRNPRPFDAAAIMNPAQPGGAKGRGGDGHGPEGAGGPPLRLIPSPHPGMPPMPKTALPSASAVKHPSGGPPLDEAGAERPALNLTAKDSGR